MPRIRVHRTRGLVHPAATNSRIKATKCFISSLRGCANEPSALIDTGSTPHATNNPASAAWR